ncbi:hypothetical protein NPIL_20321 [Nephila pilipes]|uniref:Uncharacterized protein n=1 Tax=Nephila pilipes TaxID=299642 RepID=A0A8X6NXW9_NEPPI|nr:hypothetical protein NPIL_20321 [Nephila pilipes]
MWPQQGHLFSEIWLGEYVTAYLKCSEALVTPRMRHSDLAGITVFSFANTEHNFGNSILAENNGIFSPPESYFFPGLQ